VALCLKKIENKLWELEGYVLQQRYFEGGIYRSLSLLPIKSANRLLLDCISSAQKAKEAMQIALDSLSE
jgi:hypothetical protein